MDLRNCKMCGNIYQHVNLPYCHRCIKKWEEMFVKVRDYIWDNPKANITEVSEETGVDEKIVLEFLRAGRIELREESTGLPCERCGAPIKTGRYCEECARELEVELKRGLSTAPEYNRDRADREKMYTAERMRKRKN